MSEHISVTDTAKMIRKALRNRFPGVKFSVRSDKYAGGASIRIRYTDGPFQREVEQIASLYAGASFDGMIDLKSYHTTLLADENGEAREVHFGADFVFVDRDLSPAYQAQIEQVIAEATREPFDAEREYTFPMFWDGDMELLQVATNGHWNRGYDMRHRLSYVVAPAGAASVA